LISCKHLGDGFYKKELADFQSASNTIAITDQGNLVYVFGRKKQPFTSGRDGNQPTALIEAAGARNH